MSTLFSISVEKRIDDLTVDLHVQVVHPDAMYIDDTPGFALMLLEESSKSEHPIAQELDYDSIANANWLRQYARGYITSVKKHSEHDLPPDDAYHNWEHPYWKDEPAYPGAQLRIAVTHPAWVAHLKPGMRWDSAAYEPGRNFEACAPIHPGEEEAGEVEPVHDLHKDPGFMPILRAWYSYLEKADQDIVYIPKYSKTAYKEIESYEGDQITPELMQSLIGKPVLADSYGKEVGVLIEENSMFTLRPGSYGLSGVYPGSLKSIAPIAFNTRKKRLKEPLTYQQILAHPDPHVFRIETEATTATFHLYAWQDDWQLHRPHFGTALNLLMLPLHGSFSDYVQKDLPICQFMAQELKARDIHFREALYSQIAGGIVKDFKIEQVQATSHPDLDSLDQDELLQVFQQNPWNTWRLEVEVYREEWIAHLRNSKTFWFSPGYSDEPPAWEGEPLQISIDPPQS